MRNLTRQHLDEALRRVQRIDFGERRVGTTILWPFEEKKPPRVAEQPEPAPPEQSAQPS